MIIRTEVSACIHKCPFYATSLQPGRRMYCNHPTFKDRKEDRYIIDWRFHKIDVPTMCPLKDHIVITKVSLKESTTS